MSWNLINEPRCDAVGCNKNIQAWVEEMAPYLKSVDPNHLVTIGEGASSAPMTAEVGNTMHCCNWHDKHSAPMKVPSLAGGLSEGVVQAWMASMTGAAVRQHLATRAAGQATQARTSCHSMQCRLLTMLQSTCGRTTGSAQTRILAESGLPTTVPMGLSSRNQLC